MKEKSCKRQILLFFTLLILSIWGFPKVEYSLYKFFNRLTIYNNSTLELSLAKLAWEHVVMSAWGCAISIILGLIIGVFCVTKIGSEFRIIIEKLMSLSQSLSTIGLLAMLVPIFGFGVIPGAIVLVIGGTMPIVFSTITGLENVPKDLIETANGLGMTRFEVFLKVKVPCAFPVILAGLRTTSIIIIGSATVAAITGAGGLGIPIFSAGIRGFNPVKLLEGTIPVTLMALFVDRMFELAEIKAIAKYGLKGSEKN